MARILLVDDEPNVLKVLNVLLDQAGHECDGTGTAEDALKRLDRTSYDLMICDLRLGQGMNGLELLHEAKEKEAHLPVILITAYGTIEVAVEAMKEGAFDFIRKPFKMQELLQTVESALRHRRVNVDRSFLSSTGASSHFGSLVGESETMLKVYDLIERVAKSDTTVLIQGDSGTGKELVAKAIHDCSNRSDGPWVPLNCAALPAPLLESEIFGHAAGSFTGATQTRDGLFLAANKGTLFLDEIGSMELSIQSKFLRALQDRKVRRVGENVDTPVDVRVVAAANELLETKRDAGEFREDLFYRISVIPIFIPALRHRTEDIPLLVQHFCRQHSEALGREVTMSGDVMEALTEYSWPGNIRELENAVACAATLSRTGAVELADLPPNIAGSIGAPADAPRETASSDAARGRSLREYLRDKEKEYMGLILDRTGGNRARAAGLLGISRATLYRKLELE